MKGERMVESIRDGQVEMVRCLDNFYYNKFYLRSSHATKLAPKQLQGQVHYSILEIIEST